jgi:hypothetical protein
MIHDPSFRLEEAMAAIEQFDPKMDSGIGAQNQSTVARLIADGIVASPATLTHAALCDLFDALLAREVEFHSGETLAETVFACLYVLSNAELPLHSRAIVRGALRACAAVHDLVVQARISVEEDFVASVQGVELPSISDPLDVLTADCDAAIAALAGAATEADSARLLLRLQLRRATLVALSFVQEATFGGPAIKQMSEAVAEVLRLAGELRSELVALDGEPAPPATDLHAHRGRGTSKLVVPPSVATIFDASRARRLLRPFPPRHVRRRTRVQAVTEYTTLFTQLQNVLTGLWRDNSTRMTSEHAMELYVIASDPAKVPTPRKHAVSDAKFLALALFAESGITLAQMFEKQRATVVSRSFLALMMLPYTSFGGWGDASDFVLAGVRGLWSMIDQSLAARMTHMLATACDLAPTLADFVNLLGRVERNLLCFRCSESAQFRRKLGHVIQDYGEMQRRAATLEEAIAPFVTQASERELVLMPLFKWLIDRTCSAVATYTELGIAHGVYEPWELPHVYWLLEHIFQTQHRNHVFMLHFGGRHRAQAEREERASDLDRQAARAADKARTGKQQRIAMVRKQKELEREAERVRTTPISPEEAAQRAPEPAAPMVIIEAKAQLARGILLTLLACKNNAVLALAAPPEPLPVDPEAPAPAASDAQHVSRPRVALQLPTAEHMNAELMYNHRFAVLHAVENPAPLAYESFRSQADLLLDSNVRLMVTQASESLKRARSGLELGTKALMALSAPTTVILAAQREESRALVAVALATSLELMKWPAVLPAPRSAVLRLTWPSHASYCVVKLEQPVAVTTASPAPAAAAEAAVKAKE